MADQTTTKVVCPHCGSDNIMMFTTGSVTFNGGELYDSTTDHAICENCGTEILEFPKISLCEDCDEEIPF